MDAIIIQPNRSAGVAQSIDKANAAGTCTIDLLMTPDGRVEKVYPGMKACIGWNE